MRKRNKTDATTLTRRTLLGDGLACALASRRLQTGPQMKDGASRSGTSWGSICLLGCARATTVIAVTWPARFSSPRSEMRIHIGSHRRASSFQRENRSQGMRMGFGFSPALSCSTRKRPMDIQTRWY